MSFDDGIVRIRFAELSNPILSNGAYMLTEDEYSPVINRIGEAFLDELKARVGSRSNEWHDIDLQKFSEAELILAETQLDLLRDEVPDLLASYFNVFKLAVHHELIRRSGPGRQ